MRAGVLALLLGAAAPGCADDTGRSTAVLATVPTESSMAPSPSTAPPSTAAPSTAPNSTAAPSTAPPGTAPPGTSALGSGVPVFPGTAWELGELSTTVDRESLDAAVDVAFGAPDAAAVVISIVMF